MEKKKERKKEILYEKVKKEEKKKMINMNDGAKEGDLKKKDKKTERKF